MVLSSTTPLDVAASDIPDAAIKVPALWEFRGVTADVRAGLVPAWCGATIKVARTPRNPEDPRFSLFTVTGKMLLAPAG